MAGQSAHSKGTSDSCFNSTQGPTRPSPAAGKRHSCIGAKVTSEMATSHRSPAAHSLAGAGGIPGSLGSLIRTYGTAALASGYTKGTHSCRLPGPCAASKSKHSSRKRLPPSAALPGPTCKITWGQFMTVTAAQVKTGCLLQQHKTLHRQLANRLDSC